MQKCTVNCIGIELDSFVSRIRECGALSDGKTKVKFRDVISKHLKSNSEITVFLDTVKTVDCVDGSIHAVDL